MTLEERIDRLETAVCMLIDIVDDLAWDGTTGIEKLRGIRDYWNQVTAERSDLDDQI